MKTPSRKSNPDTLSSPNGYRKTQPWRYRIVASAAATLALATGTLVCAASPASAAPSSSDPGYFRIEFDKNRQPAAVGRIPKGLMQAMSASHNKSKAAAVWACSGYVTDKVPGNWFVSSVAGLAVTPVCVEIANSLWGPDTKTDRAVCFKVPLGNVTASKVRFC